MCAEKSKLMMSVDDGWEDRSSVASQTVMGWTQAILKSGKGDESVMMLDIAENMVMILDIAENMDTEHCQSSSIRAHKIASVMCEDRAKAGQNVS